jgi:hypothetical protein
VEQTADGGFVAAGHTGSADGDVTGHHEESDWWVLRLGPKGALVWEKALGGSCNEEAASVRQTADGGFVVAGHAMSPDGDVTESRGGADAWIVKLTPSGALEWQRALGGSEEDCASQIRQTADGGYVFAGHTTSDDGDVSGSHGGADFWIVKLGPRGELEWQKTLGGSGADKAHSVLQTPDGGYIAAGETSSNDGDVSGNHGKEDFWVVKLGPKGALEWQKAMGGSDSDSAKEIQAAPDGGYIVGGSSSSQDGDAEGNRGWQDYWVVKLAPEAPAAEERPPSGAAPRQGSAAGGALHTVNPVSTLDSAAS